MTQFLPDFPDSAQGGIVAIGNFDGVHRGHQRMIRALREQADHAAAPAVALTFEAHPQQLLRPGSAPQRLSTAAGRESLLKQFGVDQVVLLPLCQDLFDLSPADFFEEVILQRLRARGLVEGPNFCFGKDRAGDITVLSELCSSAGVSLSIVDPVSEGSLMISSSRIRQHLKDGEIRIALQLLGHSYTLTGQVTQGAQRGRQLGFPTANLSDVETLIPADGVYAAIAQTELDGVTVQKACAVSIGPNPTFDDQTSKIECHLLEFSGDLYGSTLTVSLLDRIRGLTPFSDAESLRRQIETDIQSCRTIAQAALTSLLSRIDDVPPNTGDSGERSTR